MYKLAQLVTNNGFNGFLIYHTCTTLQKKNEYKKEKKGRGNRIYNPRGLDQQSCTLHDNSILSELGYKLYAKLFNSL